MPDYKTGTYIIRAHKSWTCQDCGKLISYGEVHFVRIAEYGDEMTRWDGQKYRQKNYYRYHLLCARTLKDLNQYESGLLVQKGHR